jgi:putative Mg2+ transporter-C (MgtC) family protein
MLDSISSAIREGHFILPLISAVILGSLIGLERQIHGRPAGLRTHILVCLGSAAVIVAFQRLSVSLQAQGGTVFRMDPARAAAGIITGIGFLGAGTIIKGKDFVTGLTTAATIWVVAALGIAAGLQQYLLAFLAALMILLTLTLLDRIKLRSDRYGEINLAGKGGGSFYRKARSRLAPLNLTIKGYRVEDNTAEGTTRLNFVVRFKDPATGERVREALSAVEGCDFISWEE